MPLGGYRSKAFLLSTNKSANKPKDILSPSPKIALPYLSDFNLLVGGVNPEKVPFLNFRQIIYTPPTTNFYELYRTFYNYKGISVLMPETYITFHNLLTGFEVFLTALLLLF